MNSRMSLGNFRQTVLILTSHAWSREISAASIGFREGGLGTKAGLGCAETILPGLDRFYPLATVFFERKPGIGAGLSGCFSEGRYQLEVDDMLPGRR